MAFGKSKEVTKPTVTVTVHVGGDPIEVGVELYGSGPITEASVWATVSTHMTNATITRNRTPDGRIVIVNWPHVHAVSYRVEE